MWVNKVFLLDSNLTRFCCHENDAITSKRDFGGIYKKLNENVWILCIPSAECLTNVDIDYTFICSHVLKPSPLLKLHYIPLISSDVEDVEIEECTIICTHKNGIQQTIEILGEEIAYNSHNEQYRILLIKSPLVKRSTRETCEQKPMDNASINSSRLNLLLRAYSYIFLRCEQYLRNSSSRITEEIAEKTKKLGETYMLLPTYLEDAAKRFKAVIDWGIMRFRNEGCDQSEDEDGTLAICVESFVIGLAYDKIFEVVRKRCAHKDEDFYRKVQDLRCKNLTGVDFGAQSIFKDLKRKPTTDHLSKLNKKITPLEKVNCLKKTADSINNVLGEHIKSFHLPFDSPSQFESVTGDDLVAFTNFSWYLPSKNEFAYSLVTFEVAMEYIKHFEKANKNIVMDDERNQFYQSEYETRPAISQFDSQLENITEMIKASKDLPSHANDSRTQKSEEEELGEFLATLSKRQYIVGTGKQD
ncbi:Ankyrin repeat domain-containing protein 27-like protein [Dinothrombium tinctorium]|uniref:Ankyrin repeat domain-containing protein 27-like protein n=1 Tax=Dinothrombium tinctorium TaxID=1965070 RepID=A0A3S3PUU2_9ACAR|nr:Ankyrin repeat domain-containing protein 27-like protein [Dinothrombium tinctorium]RWS12796.1 Ankyrin repeat domain-containing protein 27-like protein [Dinothrombium tinctorium]RWS16777.1 Ankyrin repeat domain-containing protein 27-like protein [Dinothrombium tinctorium]